MSRCYWCYMIESRHVLKTQWPNKNGNVKNKNRKVKNKNEITIWPPWASVPMLTRNFCHVLGLKIALILLLRHFWTLNFSSLKQRKGNNIYKLTQTWNSECSSYKFSIWQRTNVRTVRVCLQQRSSKVTWNYTWNLTLRRWTVRGAENSHQNFWKVRCNKKRNTAH